MRGGEGGSPLDGLTGALPSPNSVWTFKIYIFFNLKGKKKNRVEHHVREFDGETNHTVAHNNTTALEEMGHMVRQPVCFWASHH